MRSPFLQQSNERRLPPDYAGDVLVWDIDKTYLDTRFSSLRGLLGIPFELAIDKRSIPGAAPLLRALRHGPGPASALVPLYFVSGSPLELRPTIERKMTLDGVDFDGITFKDQLGLLKSGRLRELRSQVGHKLRALLLYRREIPEGARWLLFGDDVEQDAEAFLLFGRVCKGLRGESLSGELMERGLRRDEIEETVRLAAPLATGTDPVEQVFIHLEAGSPPERFTFDRRLVPTRSFLQTALVLAQLGRIRRDAVGTVARDLRLRHVPEADLVAQLADAGARLGVPEELLALARGGA